MELLLNAQESDDVAAEAATVLRALVAKGGLGPPTPDGVWYAVSRVVSRDGRRKQGKLLTADDARRLFDLVLNEAASAARREKPDIWGILLDIADACPPYVNDEDASTMRRRMLREALVGAGEQGERESHAEMGLRSLGPAVWLDVPNGALAIFEGWFRKFLHGEGLRAAIRYLQFLDGATRLDLLRHVLETPGRLDTDEAIGFVDDAGYTLAALSMWWREDSARQLVQSWCTAGERLGAIADANVWRTLLSRFAWCLQNDVRHAKPGPDAEPILQRFVPLMTLAWSAWSRVIDEEAERNLAVGWSVVAPLARQFEGAVVPVGGWSASLRELLARVIAEGGRNDISALQDIDWSSIDDQTVAAAARSTVARAGAEITSRPSTDWMIDGLIIAMGDIGASPAIPLDEMRAVLDCLHRLGKTVPRANVVAATIEIGLRSRDPLCQRS